MMKESYKIYIGNLERYITSYEHMLWMEPGDLKYGSGPLTAFQYLSCLFNNLGYDKCPKDFVWLENNIDIENAEKTEVLDYPIVNHPLMLVKGYDLWSLLLCIKNWIRSDIEKGHLLDPNKSFKLPSQKDIRYYLQNRMKIKRSVVLQQKVQSWDKSDLIWRRLYNLNPSVDRDYFDYHLTNFERYAKQIRIEYPQALFVSVLVDPDILLSVIKYSEIEATSIVAANHTNTPVALLNDIEIFREFERILKNKVDQMNRIFKNRGARGFIFDEYKIVKVVPGRISTLTPNINLIAPIFMGQDRDVDNSIIGEVFYQIANIPINGDTIAEILKYVDINSLKFIDRMGCDNIQRLATYKRLYYTLEQLKRSNPELVSPKDRFIMSESFYIDSDSFALYSKKMNKIYVVSKDLILREMDPVEAVEYYQNILGLSIEMDPNEICNIKEPDPVPYIDLNQLEQKSMGNVIVNSNPIIPSSVTIIPNVNKEELYGFDVNNLVYNY